jgi:hypothetical protein
MPTSIRTSYGPSKYAALHLLFARWLRHFAQPGEYVYVTLGGTELRCVQSLYFIDPSLVTDAISIEEDRNRLKLAGESAKVLLKRNLEVTVSQGDIFGFRRTSNKRHFFFIDLEGPCALGNYPHQFAQLLRKEILKEGDALFITSYLGRNIGWKRLFKVYDAEFRMLGLTQPQEKQVCYRRAHPSFTLFRALNETDLQSEISLTCIGCVEYVGTSPMAVYGYNIAPGNTNLKALVEQAPYFHTKKAFLETMPVNSG